MKSINQINIFISCTSEIVEEIDSIKLIVEEINKTSGKQSRFLITSLNWNLDTYTQIGEDAQEVINSQLGSGYDILVALLWQKIGTPTKRHKSGTVEEICNAIENEKEFLICFKTTPPDNLNLIDLKQLAEINSFKEELKGKGVLYKEFNTIGGFESLFRINIINLINDKFLDQSAKHGSQSSSESNDRYGSISSLIELVESKGQDPAISIDTFQLAEQMLAYFQRVTSSLRSMTAIYNGLTAKMSAKTEELDKLKAVNDNALRLHKTEIIINLLADELDDFNSRMNNELRSFSENFLLIGPAYSKINSVVSGYEIEEISSMRQSFGGFRDSVEAAIQNSAAVLRVAMKWPPMTARFNKSKRTLEVTIKDVTKEMLTGLKLLDEAIGEK